MNIWVVRETYMYDSDTYLTTHLTEKGALIQAIDCVREHVRNSSDEDLKGYSSEQLQKIVHAWWDYSNVMNDTMQYEIHQTVVTG